MQTKGKILIVDDDPNILALLTEVIALEGWQVLSATNGEDGLQVFKSKRPDLLIVDGLLPKMNGFELAAKIRSSEQGRRIPIIMISGVYKTLRINEQIRDLQINEFLEKPFALESLLSRVKELASAYIEKSPALAFFRNQGELQEMPIPKLLYILFSQRKNGILTLVKEKLKKRIYIRNGEPTFVESNLVQECLGKVLVRKGKLTEEQCNESLRMMQSQKSRQGRILINMGLLTPTELDEALKDQALERILEIFTWTEGSYRLQPPRAETPNLTTLSLSLPQILLRGVRSGFPEAIIREEIGPYSERSIRIKNNPLLKFDDFRFASWDEQILNQVNGSNTLSDIVQSTEARELDIYQLIYTCLITDMIEFVVTSEEREEQNVYLRLIQIFEELRQQNYFKVLDVSRQPTPKELFEHMSEKMATYHPVTSDFNPTKSKKIHRVLTKITDIFKTAYDILNDPKQRQKYERQLFYSDGIIPMFPSRVFDQNEEFRKIKVDLSRGDFDNAETNSKAMALLFPGDWRFKAYHGWALFKKLCQRGQPASAALESAIIEISSAIQMDPNEPSGYLFLGNIYKYLKKMDKAVVFFQEALQRDANLIEARRELRLISHRRDKKAFLT